MKRPKKSLDQRQREEIVRHLSNAPHEELREILFEVFQTQRPNPEEDKYYHNCFFLGTSSRKNEARPGKPPHWGPPEIQAVAYIDHDLWPASLGPVQLGPDWGFCQFGTCECGVEVRSNYKEGICPICSAKVFMT